MKLGDVLWRNAWWFLILSMVGLALVFVRIGQTELAAAVVGGLLASIGTEAARLALRAHLSFGSNGVVAQSILSRVELRQDGLPPSSTQARYLQVAVMNGGSVSAQAARAYIAGALFRHDHAAAWKPIGCDEPVAIEWGGLGGIEATIPVGVRHCVNIIRAVQYPAPRGNVLEVCGPHVPFSLGDALGDCGHYKFKIIVAAENAPPKETEVVVTWVSDTFTMNVQEGR